nr:retropepsin-like aspartic protease [Endozoicomonas sp.]
MKLADRFQSPILCILSILVGLSIGWWLRDSQGTPEYSVVLNKSTEQSHDHAIVLETDQPLIDEKTINHQKIQSTFIQALESKQFEDALIIYQHHEQFHSEFISELHDELIRQVRQYHDKNLPISILELFTQYFYQDVELLNELATHYISTHQLAKALEVFASARSYSYTREAIRGLDDQIHQIAHAVFEKNRGLPDLESLIPVFLKLSYLEPDYSFYRLVLAEGYLMLNEPESALRELQIVQMDEGLNEHASQLLARLLPEPTGEEPADEKPAIEKNTVPLTEAGGHFVVDTLAGNTLNVRLLIDTGASLTTLSHRILKTLQQKKQASQIGYIDLKTAGGSHRAPLYRLDQLRIGDFLVNNLKAAELGPIDQDVDGLLGMNFLSHFSFFIDQNLRQLSLTPR